MEGMVGASCGLIGVKQEAGGRGSGERQAVSAGLFGAASRTRCEKRRKSK